MKTCSRCKQNKPINLFGRNKTTKSGTSYYCKSCGRKASQEHNDRKLQNDPIGFYIKKMIFHSQRGSLKRNTPNTIKEDNIRLLFEKIGKNCPCCKAVFTFTSTIENKMSAPSLDCINPSYGYIPNNITLLCGHCNLAKNGMTLEQAKYFVQIMEKSIKLMGELSDFTNHQLVE